MKRFIVPVASCLQIFQRSGSFGAFLRYLIFIIFLFSFAIAQAYTLSGIPSAFLDVGLGARYMGLAGVDVPLSNDATSILSNPANMLLSRNKYNFSADYSDLYTLYNYTFFGATAMVDNGLKMGLGFIYSGDEAMSETTVILSVGAAGGYMESSNGRRCGSNGEQGQLGVSSQRSQADGALGQQIYA